MAHDNALYIKLPTKKADMRINLKDLHSLDGGCKAANRKTITWTFKQMWPL